MTQDFESEIRKGNNSSLGGLMVPEDIEWASLASSLSTPLLVPLRTKFHSANPKELPGWRGERPQIQDEESDLSIRSRSPPFVNSKREWNASPMYPRHEKSKRLLEVPLLLPKIKSKPELIALRPFSHEMRGVDEDFASKASSPFDIKPQELRKTQNSALETQSTLEATLPPIKNSTYGFSLKRPSSKGLISLEVNEEKDPIIYTESLGIQNLTLNNEDRKLQFGQNSAANPFKTQFTTTVSSKTDPSTGKNEIKKSQKLSYGPIPEDEEQSPTPYSQPDLKVLPSSPQEHKLPYPDNPRLMEIYKQSPELKLDKNIKIRRSSDSQTTFRKDEVEEFKQEMFKELFFAAPADRKSSAKLTPSNKKTLLHTFLKALITGEIRNRAEAQEFIDNELSRGVVIVKQSRGNSSSSSATRFVLSPNSDIERTLSPERSQNIIIQPHQPSEIEENSIRESPRKTVIKTPTKAEIIIPASELKLKPNFADLNKIEYENEESDSEIDININSSFHNEIQNNSLEERQPSPQNRQRSSSFSGKKQRENTYKSIKDEITLIPSAEREEKISPRQEEGESLISKARRLKEKWAEEDRKKTITKEIHKAKEEYEEVEEKEIVYDNETGEMIEKIIKKARLRREETKREEEKKAEGKKIAEEAKKEKSKLEFLEAPNPDLGRAQSEFLSPKRKDSFNPAPERRLSADIRTDTNEKKSQKTSKKIKKSSKSPADTSLSKSPPLSRVPSLKKSPSTSKAPSPMPQGKLKKNKKKNKKQKQKNKEQVEKENEEGKALISEWSENMEIQPLQLNEKIDKDESPTLEGEAPKTNRSKKSVESQKTVKSEKGNASPRKTDSKARISRESAKNTENAKISKAGSNSPSPARDRTPLDENGSPIIKEKRKTIIKKSESPPKDIKPTPRMKPMDRFVRNFSKSLLQTVSIMVITLKNELQKAEPLLENVDPYEIVARRKKITRKINKIRKKTRIELEKQIVLKDEEINETPLPEERKTENKLEDVNEEDKEQEQAELIKAKSYAPERSSTFKELNDSRKASEAPPRLEKEKSNFGISNASKYFSKALMSKVQVSHSSTKNRIVSESETEESGTEQDESEGSLGTDTARLEIVSSKPLNVAYDRARASVNYELQNFNLVSQMAKHILAGTEEPAKPQILAQPAVSEFFKKLVPNDTTHKSRGPIKADPTNAPEEEEFDEEPIDPYANTLDVDEELLSMFTGKTTNIKKFVFTPQVQFKFPQKFDANQETDVNDIELANFNIDQENFEASMLKKRFYELSKFLPTYEAYAKKQNGVLFSSEIEEQHPDEAQLKRIRDFEKKRKKERMLRMRGKNKPVELGGKPKKTFTNLDDNGQQHKRKNVKHIPNLITDIDIIKSGGANEVEDELDRDERIYCRLKGNFELNSLKLPQKRSYKGSKSVRSLIAFSTFQSDRSSKHYKTGFIL
ncbi:unnamed protein product [Blepharisma stoltei]|uniref:Uncharacterized protein n=1 Tax=Blepharisma stoltei TaxID=1481888 RepID=A0AAU9JYU2_9CILI|nr:unnamed protein product [Blepharisma stoltei]